MKRNTTGEARFGRGVVWLKEYHRYDILLDGTKTMKILNVPESFITWLDYLTRSEYRQSRENNVTLKNVFNFFQFFYIPVYILGLYLSVSILSHLRYSNNNNVSKES